MFRPWMSLKVRSALPQGLKYKPKAGHEIKKASATACRWTAAVQRFCRPATNKHDTT